MLSSQDTGSSDKVLHYPNLEFNFSYHHQVASNKVLHRSQLFNGLTDTLSNRHLSFLERIL